MPPILLIGDETATYKEAGATTLKIATAFQFEAKHTGFVEELFFRTGSIANTGTTKLVLGIYAEGATAPTGKPLGSGELKETPLASNAWLSVSGLKIFVKQGTRYWLAALALGGTINYNTSVLTLGTPDSKSVTENETLEENTWGGNLKTGPVGFYGLGTELRFQAQLTSSGSLTNSTIARALFASFGLTPIDTGLKPGESVFPHVGLFPKTGNLPQTLITHQFASTLTFIGFLQNLPTKTFKATLRFVGFSPRQTVHRLNGGFSFSIQLLNRITYEFRSTLIFAGSLPLLAIRKLTGALAIVGASPITVSRRLIGELRTSSKTPGKVYHSLIADMAFVGVTRRSILHQLQAALQSAGRLKQHNLIFKRTVNPVLLQFVYGPDQLILHPSVSTLTLYMPRVIPDRLTHSESTSRIIERSPGRFEDDISSPNTNLRAASGWTESLVRSTLNDVTVTLTKIRNHTALIEYDREHNAQKVSKSYYED